MESLWGMSSTIPPTLFPRPPTITSDVVEPYIRPFASLLGQSTTHFSDMDAWATVIAASYLTFLLLGRLVMHSFPPLSTRSGVPQWLFFLWNVFLAVYSGWATWVAGECLLPRFFSFGFKRTVGWADDWSLTCLEWSTVYVASKVAEFNDTTFLVLKKKPIPFLHWGHHFLTFVVCYKWLRETEGYDGLNRALASANTFVHTIMYSYYAARTLHWNPPQWVPQAITTMQLIQMTYLCITIVLGFWWGAASGLVASIYGAMVGLYWVLFAQLYVSRYVGKKGKKGGKRE